MLRLGVSPSSKIAAQSLYWDVDKIREFGVYSDAERGGILKSGIGYYGYNDILTDIHPQEILISDKSGSYASKAVDEICHGDFGLVTVPTSTNHIRNNSMIGASGGSGTLPNNWVGAGVASSLTRVFSAVGTSNGMPYADLRIHGTASANGVYGVQFESPGQVAAVQGEKWSGSVFAAIVGGSTANISAIVFRGVRGFNASSIGTEAVDVHIMPTLTANMQRFSQTVTLANATTVSVAPQLYVSYTTGAVIDITIRIWAPQLEKSDFITPPILTTSAAVTRTGNKQSIANLDTQLANGFAGFIKLDLKVIVAGYTRLLCVNNGTSNDRVVIHVNSSGELSIHTIVENIQQSVVVLKILATTGIQTIAFSVGPNFTSGRVVGEAAVLAATPSSYPSLNRIAIGGDWYDTSRNSYQHTKKFGFKFGPQSQATLDEIYAIAEAA